MVDNFNLKRSNVENYGAFRHGTVSYYKGGVNYYPIMIKHDDTDQVYNEYGEFGVVRNSVYDVHISKVNNPGYPNIPEPDPGTNGRIYCLPLVKWNAKKEKNEFQKSYEFTNRWSTDDWYWDTYIL